MTYMLEVALASAQDNATVLHLLYFFFMLLGFANMSTYKSNF